MYLNYKNRTFKTLGTLKLKEIMIYNLSDILEKKFYILILKNDEEISFEEANHAFSFTEIGDVNIEKVCYNFINIVSVPQEYFKYIIQTEKTSEILCLKCNEYYEYQEEVTRRYKEDISSGESLGFKFK